MDIRPLHTEDDYRAMLAEVSALVDQDPEPGTPEGDRLEILSILVEHYEHLMETAHLLRSPSNAAHLERSITQLRAGKVRRGDWVSLPDALAQPGDADEEMAQFQADLLQSVREMKAGAPRASARAHMTVADLIDYLRTFPLDARVVVRNFNSGFDDIARVHALPIRRGTAQLGSGAHARPDLFSEIPLRPDETAIVIDCDIALD